MPFYSKKIGKIYWGKKDSGNRNASYLRWSCKEWWLLLNLLRTKARYLLCPLPEIVIKETWRGGKWDQQSQEYQHRYEKVMDSLRNLRRSFHLSPPPRSKACSFFRISLPAPSHSQHLNRQPQNSNVKLESSFFTHNWKLASPASTKHAQNCNIKAQKMPANVVIWSNSPENTAKENIWNKT